MRKLLAAVAVAGLCGLTGTALSAQRARAHAAPASSGSSVRFGPQINFGTDIDFGIGGRAEFDLRKAFNAPMFGVASFDYFFPGNSVTYWEINADVFYNIPVSHTTLRPYAGGGLDIAHTSVSILGVTGSATNAGLNLGGGTKFEMRNSKITPYAEMRIELRTGGEFVLTGGILF
jgi:hypothetical protein